MAVGGVENSDYSLTPNKRKSKDTDDKTVTSGDPKKAKIDTKSKNRPGFTEERFNETSYYHENGNSQLSNMYLINVKLSQKEVMALPCEWAH